MKFIKTMISAVALAASGAASSAVVDFLYQGNVMATMTTTGSTSFTLDFVSAPNSQAFINDLFLVGPGGTFSDSNTATDIQANYSAFMLPSSKSKGGLGQGKAFNWDLDFPQSNNADRFTIGESASWSIATTTDINLWGSSELHINSFMLVGNSIEGIKINGCIRGSLGCGQVSEPTSIVGGQVPEPASLVGGQVPEPASLVGGQVPEPASLALLGLGLLGMGAVRRFRTADKA